MQTLDSYSPVSTILYDLATVSLEINSTLNLLLLFSCQVTFDSL